ncbi:hypothetical protein PV10_04089 [Exophiala mesophila]|uniref:Zn(2)-C6 fungal-type domain-containing protein n=1 Tax=Exophiala mesophila TaxID=212818 RepID=A0A0D2A181_EXOME|nr:uncharacterized protein PV10_04089 [Exophiala mesophila]KIV92823.1 hypothetical protein PV10_04089 [Exophiala mesophila]
MSETRRVRRTATSCARCRHRKVTCDANTPSCSSCYNAGVPCVAWNSATNNTAPRSITRYLEERIAALESPQRPSNAAMAEGRGPPGDMGLTVPLIVDDAICDIMPSFLGITQDSCLAGCVAAPTEIPSAKKSFGMSDLDQSHPRTILNQQSSNMSLTSIPIRVAEFLLTTYLTRIIHQYPIFHIRQVENAFAHVFYSTTTDSIPAWDEYIVSIIMAISLSTAARNKQAHANSIAAKLFRNAMFHRSTVMSYDIYGLQALLLLIQYTFLNPSMANLWLLTGISSEACIEMGLHREVVDSSERDLTKQDMRRRIFWCAWEMEVAVSAGFHRPIRTLTKYIHVPFPSQFDDSAIHKDYIDTTGSKVKFVSHRIRGFRLVESAAISVLYQNEPLPADCPSLECWITQTETEIRTWLDEVHKSASWNQDAALKPHWDEMVLYAEIAYHWIIVLLFGPSPRVKTFNTENLMKALRSSVQVATGYWQQANTEFGRIKYVFHPLYHAFSSAVVFLQVLQSCTSEVAKTYSLEEVEELAHCFSRVFSTISERWPAATRCLQEYDRLLSPIKRKYSDFLLQERGAQFHRLGHDPENDPTEILGDVLGFTDTMNFMPPLEPFMDISATSVDPYAFIPHDWDAEFDFGMDLDIHEYM